MALRVYTYLCIHLYPHLHLHVYSYLYLYLYPSIACRDKGLGFCIAGLDAWEPETLDSGLRGRILVQVTITQWVQIPSY